MTFSPFSRENGLTSSGAAGILKFLSADCLKVLTMAIGLVRLFHCQQRSTNCTSVALRLLYIVVW